MKLKSLISPSYNLLLAAGSLLAVVSFFSKMQVDFHVNDTYFVVSGTYFIWATSIIVVGFWLIYRASCKILLSPILTWVHVLSTILGIAIIFFSSRLGHTPQNTPGLSVFNSYNTLVDLNRKVALLALLLLAGQAAFAINIAFGTVKYIFGKLSLKKNLNKRTAQ